METIELTYPVEYEGQTITELTLRRPKMRDLKKSQRHKDELEKSMAMMADLSDMPPRFIEELDPDDFKRVSAKLGEFMGVSEEQTP